MDFGRAKKRVASRNVVSPAAGRLRIRWGRTESRRMLSHLDNMRVIENAVRDSQFPVAYTQGKHPRMKLSFCPPLPMGFTSESEYTDITLDQYCTNEMIVKIRKSLPDGFQLLEAKTVFAKSTSLSEAINRVVYILNLADGLDNKELNLKISELLNRPTVEINRKTKSGESVVDIRPAICDIKIFNNELVMTLGIGDGYARPTEVAKILFDYDEERAAALPFHRKEMFRMTDDNRRIEGIEL